MAVVVGTAQGKLTLDASKFIANIDSSYKALKNFYDLIGDTQKALEKIPKDVSVNVNTNAGQSSIFGTTDDTPDFTGINDSISATTSNVNTLKGALSKGLMGALKGVGELAKVTFEGFKKYTEFVVDFSKQSLEVGQQFDATMSQVGAISGATGEEFDSLREKALEMGAQTKFSASEAGQALVYMGMAGWKTEDMLDGVEGIMSLAAASGEDLATTSDIVTDALTAFGLEAKDAAHFSDVLAAAATNSNTNVALMGETFKYVAPLAGTMKYGIEDTAVAIGLMANSGIKGSQAGTALRNIISNLASPTDKVAAAMEDLGISLSDNEGNTKSLMQLMKDLRASFADIPGGMDLYQEQLKAINNSLEAGAISEEDYYNMIEELNSSAISSLDEVQAKAASAIAGKYGLSGLLAIVNASDEDFQALTESIYAASDGMGAANEMSEKMMDNLTGSVTIFKSTLETFQITISDLLKGPANELVKFGQQAISGMTDAMQKEGIPGLIKAVGGIIPEAANMIVQYLPQILPSLIDGFWALVNGVIDALPEALPIVVDAAIMLFMGLVTGLNDAVERLLPMIPDLIEDICNGFDENVDEFLDTAIELFLNLVEGAIRALPRIIQTAATLVQKVAQTLFEHRGEILDTAIDLLLALIEGLTDPDTIESLILAVFGIVQLIIDTFGETDWLEVADKVFSGLGKGLLGIFEGALGAIDELLGTDFASWAAEVGKFFDYLKQQSAQFGWDLARTMQKTEIELNELGEKYDSVFDDFRKMYADLVKNGVDAQEAMAAAYQKYFTSAESQYYFKERLAGQYVGDSIIAQQMGTQNMNADQLIDLLTRTQVASGNTYNFYSPKVIDEKQAADEIRKTNEDLLLS